MNWRAIKAVMVKDLRVVLRSKMLVATMILVPLIMMVLLPGGIGLAANFFGDEMVADMGDFDLMLEMMPDEILTLFDGLDPIQLIVTLTLAYLFAPMFLIIPLMVSSVIAADSFVGERERKTLEALLYTPITNWELMIAKMLAAWIAAVFVGVVGFILYCVISNAVAWPIMGRIFMPNAMWFVLVLWVSPAVAGLGLGVTVLGSTRANTFQEASQVGGVLVLPIVALLAGQIAGLVYLSAWVAAIMGAIVWAVDVVILWFGVKTFDRDALFSKL